MLDGRRRIMLIGNGGAGKTTFARKLGQVTKTPPDVWRERVLEVAQQDQWIMDGNYSGSLSERIALADAVVFFDIHRVVCTAAVLERVVRHQFRPREELPEGCPETIHLELLWWVWNFPRN